MHRKIDWKKYLIVFLITISLFLTASYVSNYFGNQKIAEIKSIQDNIAINILSSETQFALLQDFSCRNVSGSALSDELQELGDKLEWSEENLGNNSEEVSYLKKYYSLLQIKDYLLMKKIAASCKVKSAFILYFYSTPQICERCQEEGIVLSTLRNKYPQLRVYSFDYSIDLSAVQAMINIYKIKKENLPALVVGDELLTGFQGLEDLETKVTKTFKLEVPQSEAVDKQTP